MHVLIAALGTAGDIHPMVGLGLELHARGHSVTLLANDYFAALARRVGLEFASLGTCDHFRAVFGQPQVWHWARGFETLVRTEYGPAVKPTFEAIARRHVPGQTVVACSTMALGARVARDKLGVPLATFHIAAASLRSVCDAPRIHPLFFPRLPAPLVRTQFWLADALSIDRELSRWVNPLRAELGLGPVRHFFGGWLQSPDRVVGLFPEWFAPPPPDWPPQTRLVGFPLYDEKGAAQVPPELEAFLAAGAAPVVFTPGSAMLDAREFFTAAAAACRALRRRGLLLSRFADQLPAVLPEGVRHFDYAPFTWLLPRAAAIVHHGGAGTTSQALAAGIPQLIMPMAHDQFDNAARAARLGVARTIARRRFRGPRVARLLAALLDAPQVAQRCHDIRRRFQGVNALAAAADLVEGLVPRGEANPHTESRD